MQSFGMPLKDGKYSPANFPYEYTQKQLVTVCQKNELEARKLKANIRYLNNIPSVSPDIQIESFVKRLTDLDYPLDCVWSCCYDPNFLATLIYNGLLVIADASPHLSPDHKYKHQWLLPKLHIDRCLVDLASFSTSKSIRKKASKFIITIDRDFDAVIRGIVNQHSDAWMYPKTIEGYKGMFSTNGSRHLVGVHTVEVWQRTDVLEATVGDAQQPPTKKAHATAGEEDEDEDDHPQRSYERPDDHPLRRPLSSALGPRWALVAGELGTTVGACYVSLTGFRNSYVDSAGTVQLHGLAALLRLRGCRMWDMGMGMEYKRALGGEDVPRREFLRRLAEVRDEEVALTLEGVADVKPVAGKEGDAVPEGAICVRALIDAAAKSSANVKIADEVPTSTKTENCVPSPA
jgi:Leu/Phe-tRNA-protein transferase